MKCQSVSNMNKQIGEKGAEISRAQKNDLSFLLNPPLWMDGECYSTCHK